MRTAVDLGVNHVSAYALTVEPTTKMGRQIAAGTLPKPDDDDEAAKYEIADDLFAAAGLEWYEISNWSRPGYESRHNLGYWRNVDWAGLGPGAHSHYNTVMGSSTDGAAANSDAAGDVSTSVTSTSMRGWDIAHPRMWGMAINDGRVPWSGDETISPTENLEELIMLGLRIREGLDIGRVNRHIEAVNRAQDAAQGTLRIIDDACLTPLVGDGLITLDPTTGHAVATRRGRLLNDAVIERMFGAVGL